jgi:signal recognition particle subunit SRP54
MAERILGLGDVFTLIEKAEERMDAAKAEQLVENLRKNRFTLEDFLEQLEEVRKLGPLSQILDRLPGAAKLKGNVSEEGEADLKRTLAVLRSMTLEERRNPSIIGGSRKKRIARGSGTRVRDVNAVLTRYEEAKRALKWVGGRHGKGHLPPDMLGVS